MLPCAILAGGLATRLRPITEKIPKALIEVAGEPFLVHQLRLLRSQGVQRAVICCGHLGEMIRDFAGGGAQFDLHLDYSFDGPTLLGTAGALKKALPLLREPFFTVYGDSYLPCDWAAIGRHFLNSGQNGLMTVFQNNGQWDSSNVEYDGSRIIRYDKKDKSPAMRYIDYGLGAFHPRAFERIASSEVHDLANLYQQLLAEGQLAAFEVTERFYEIGSFAGIEELSARLMEPEAVAGARFEAAFLCQTCLVR